jgi:hypothetical protein
MIRESQTAVIARNEPWSGRIATEPYEAFDGLDGREPPRVELRVQVSADGMRWIDEGSRFEMPRSTDQDTFTRVTHFGNWLRITGELPLGLTMKALVTLHLK